MKGVLISIQPKWCCAIASGKKTIEVRKNKPNLKTPFKCYIYCTKEAMQGTMKYLHINNGCKELGITSTWSKPNDIVLNEGTRNEFNAYTAHGKVIGEFVCDNIYPLVNPVGQHYSIKLPEAFEVKEEVKNGLNACLTVGEIFNYGKGKDLYGWHISDLKIYDKPKELSEFYNFCKEEDCDNCPYLIDYCGYEYDESDCGCNYKKPIKRPPQSWCYVEVEE